MGRRWQKSDQLVIGLNPPFGFKNNVMPDPDPKPFGFKNNVMPDPDPKPFGFTNKVTSVLNLTACIILDFLFIQAGGRPRRGNRFA